MLEAVLAGVSGERRRGAEEAPESRRKTPTEAAEEESELLAIISISAGLKSYPHCGEPRQAAAVKQKRGGRRSSDAQTLENS